jgi:hypothetical protein
MQRNPVPASRELAELFECCVFVGESEPVRSPKFWGWISFAGRNESAVNLKTLAPLDADHLKANGRIGTANPSLPVNRCIAFARDLPKLKAVMPKFFRHGSKIAFLCANLSRSARFSDFGGCGSAEQPSLHLASAAESSLRARPPESFRGPDL